MITRLGVPTTSSMSPAPTAASGLNAAALRTGLPACDPAGDTGRMPLEITDQIRRHLTEDPLAWLTTVTPSGRPAPRPIWFIWDGSTVTIYSLNNSAKLRHIEANDQVSLHFNPGPDGNDVVVIAGRARVLAEAPLPSQRPDLTAKYKDRVERMGQTTQWWDTNYSTAIQVNLERAWTIPG